MQSVYKHPSSYRDPSGFLFYHNHVLYRQVNNCFREEYDRFINSGLYQELVNNNLIIPHQEIRENLSGDPSAFITLQPEMIPFISFPYEWCFDMWKDAALNTLKAAGTALNKNMMLRDASAYNLQWHQGNMLFIDSLSFETYNEKEPWIAYRQFCEHFLAPLALMHYLKQPLQSLFTANPDGLPLQLVKKLLPFRSKFNLHTYLHLHLHANVAASGKKKPSAEFSRKKLENILNSLEAAVSSYHFDKPTGVWSGYYQEAAERDDYLVEKKQVIDQWLSSGNFSSATDLGANEGEFSLMAAAKGIYTISADSDHYSINKLYRKIKAEGIQNLHPIILDLSNPSPALGVNNTERASFLQRTKSDLVMALALIHHLAIGKNIPFDRIAELFRSAGKWLIVEFVPKTDAKVQLMLQQKKDIYGWYTRENFERFFSELYEIEDKKPVGGSERILYLMKPKPKQHEKTSTA